MGVLFQSSFIAILLACNVLGAPSASKLPLPVKILHEFPLGTWVENLAVRPNGDIIATILSKPARIYQVSSTAAYEPKLLHTWPNLTGALGITETGVDTYHVAVGNFSVNTGISTNGSYSLYKLSFGHKDQPIIAIEAPIPTVNFANGLTTLPHSRSLLLADSLAGIIYHYDIRSKKLSPFFDHPLLKSTGAGGISLGVNGVHVFNDHLYFSNLNQGLAARVKLSPNESPPTDEPEVLYTGVVTDDFAIDIKGNLFVCENPGNQLGFVGKSGGVPVTIAGSANDGLILAGPTAAAFARGRGSEGKLFISTVGGLSTYATGAYVKGGTITSVDVGGLKI